MAAAVISELTKMDPAEAMEMTALREQKAMNEVIDRGDSNVQRFYSDATVFVTGGSGFLGKLLLEKLFRSCNIKKVYVLMRGKKERKMQERFDAILQDPVFDGLRQKQPHLADKIVLVQGDVSEIRLGISDEDWSDMSQQVNVIFHVAATTRFDESLRLATLTNVRGTREVLKLAKNCEKLRAFVHVSTAYSAATRDRVGSEVLEQFYPSPVSPDAMIQMAESMDLARLNAITPQLIDGWPNTYTFTKVIAEEVVRSMSEDLPACIVRPPIVISTYSEPTPGWVDMTCIFGASGVILGVVLGVMRVQLLKRYLNISIMPADYSINLTLAAAWDAAISRTEGGKETKIYNNTSTQCGVSLDTLNTVMSAEDTRKWSTPSAIWYCTLLRSENRILYRVLFWLLHYIPAYIIDGLCFLLQVKRPQGVPPLMKVYTKIDKLSSVLSYFFTNEWSFRNDNVLSLYQRMSEDDRAIYNFDVTKVDWTEMILMWCLGIRKFIIKDGLKNTAYGYKKQKIFRVIHYIFVLIYGYILYKMLSVIYSAVTFMFYLN